MSGTKSTTFFWSDWQSDVGVRASSLAARGLWMDMLCIMANAEGYLTIAGRSVEPADLARIVGASIQEVESALADLEKHNVFSRDRRKTIYSRRMVKAEKNRRNGKLGGNPNLLKDKVIPEPVKPTPKALRPKTTSSSLSKKKTKSENPKTELANEVGLFAVQSDWPSDAFERCWDRYPNKVARKVAEAAFAKVARNPPLPWAKFCGALQRYFNKTDDRNWCHFSTWLNQARWDDIPAPQDAGKIFTKRTSHGAAALLADRKLEEMNHD